MRKTNTRNRILSVLLAFMVAFTYMPFGLWASGSQVYADEVQEISTAEEFAGMAATGSYKLTSDITVTAPYAEAFTGTFDGDGHTVTLNIESAVINTGLFSQLGGGANVKNLITAGSITLTANKANCGAIVGNANVYEGPITIENCLNTADINGYKAVGGIVGTCASTNAALTIANCANTGAITGTNVQVGGIAGNIEGEHKVINCYNTGAISGFNNYGGILGRAAKTASLTNAYTTGTITAYGTSTNAGYAVIGGSASTGASVANAYALEGVAEALNYNYVTGDSAFKSEAEMKSADFVTTLGDAFVAGSEYPELAAIKAMQVASAKVVFNVATEGATIRINGKAYSKYTVNLPAGDYDYIVEKEGYASQNGSFSISEEQAASAAEITVPEEAINLSEYTVSEIQLNSDDAKKVYDKGETLSLDGLILTVKYDGTDKETVIEGKDFDKNGVTYTGFDLSTAGTSTVTVSYKGKSTSYEITVNETLALADFFKNCPGVTVTDDAKYPFKVNGTTAAPEYIQSSNPKAEESTLTLSFEKSVRFSFSHLLYLYSTSTSTNYFTVTVNHKGAEAELLKIANYSKKWVDFTADIAAGDVVKITCKNSTVEDSGGNYIQMKNFSAVEIHNIKINPSVEGAEITLRDAEGNTVAGTDGEFLAEDGAYEYTVSLFGYETETGSITVEGSDVTRDIELKAVPGKVVTFNVTLPEGVTGDYSVTVKSGDTVINAEENGTYKLPAGEYNYTITHPNCVDAKGTVTVGDEDVSESVTMERKLVFADLFAGLDGITAKDDETYPFTVVGSYGGSDNYLQSSNIKQSYSATTSNLNLTASKTLKLSFKYKANLYATSSTYVDNNMTVAIGSTEKLQIKNKAVSQWTDCSVNVRAGETVSISHKCYSSSNSADTYNIMLKDFDATEIYEVAFTENPEGTAFTVKDKDGNDITEEPDGTYLLEPGTYTYKAESFGYKDLEGSFTVEAEDLKIPVHMTEEASFDAAFQVNMPENITSDGVAITVKSGEKTIEAQSAGSYRLPAGEYTYTVKHPKCEDVAGTFIVTDQNVTITVDMQKLWEIGDYFQGMGLTAANGTYGFVLDASDNKVLASNNQGKSSQTATLTLTATEGGQLSFQYKVSSEASYDKFNVKKNGTAVVADKSGLVDWTEVAVELSKGDVLTITYSKDSSGDRNEDTAWVKDFRLQQLHSIIIKAATEGAAIQLSDETGKNVAGTDGTFTVPDGKYNYTVALFGYETVTGEITVSGEDQNVEIPALNKLETKTLNFVTEPEDAIVTLSHATAGTLTAEDGAYTLPAGETYTYKIEKPDYISKEGTIRLAEDTTVRETLTYAGVAWDGTSKSEPQAVEGVYQIANAQQLAWFASYVSETDNAAKAVLTDNINLNNKTWTDIGKYNASGSTYADEYTGSFDGQGHVISGLSTSKGLFGYVMTGGSIKNVTVSGIVSGTSYLGGIAAATAGVIENCAFYGKVTGAVSGGMGGITGRVITGGSLKNCVNYGEIANTYSYYNSSLCVGGVAGYTYGDIIDCYNIGSVSADPAKTSNHEIGGLVGDIKLAAATIRNCYNAGIVSGPEAGTNSFAGGNLGTIENCYVISTAGPEKAIGGSGNLTGVEKRTPDQMKEEAFVAVLGLNEYNRDSEGISNGYPVLKWQGGTVVVDQDAEDVAEAKAAIDVTPKEFKEAGTIELPSAGEKETAIAWTADKAYINVETGAVTLPEEGTEEVTLTATITKGIASDEKTFTIKIWSVNAQVIEELSKVSSKIENTSIWAQEIIHPEETKVTQVVKRYLEEKNVDLKDIKITFVSPGEKVMPAGDSNVNIDENGNITYFTGYDNSSMYKYAQYSGVIVRLTKDDISVDVPLRMFISWSYDHVQKTLNKLATQITWDSIKGENTSTVKSAEGAGAGDTTLDEEDYPFDFIEGYTDKTLKLPSQVGAATVKWDYEIADESKVKVDIKEAYGSEGVYYECNLTGSPYEDEEVALFAVLSYNLLNDGEEEYIDGEETYPTVYGAKGFQFVVPVDEDALVVDPEVTLDNLTDRYEEFVKDFVTKEDVDLKAVTDDLQMPTPKDLEDSEIFLDRYNEKVEMVSGDESSIYFYGYHAYIYRPMPGEPDKTAEYTVRILDRTTEKVIAEKTFSIKIKAITQDEIDAAASIMKKVATNDVYWDGLKGANEGKNAVTENMTPFVEIHFDENGENIEYVRGAMNLTFGGIELDDIPGYDAMQAQPWREIRSSRETIVTSEQLQVSRPEHNTKLTLDSVMTYNRYAKYWEKALKDESLQEKYAQFEQFYKQPVSVVITVLGTEPEDPDNPVVDKETVTATVAVNGDGFEGFLNIESFAFEQDNIKDYTAWDCLKACLEENGYTWNGGGSYVKGVTDTNGVSLDELEHGEMSGWMYTVNGELPDVSLAQYYIKDGDKIEFYYSGEKEPVHEHSWSEDYKVIAEATCTEAGSEVLYCTECGEINEESAREIPALGHKYKVTKIANAATCTEAGNKEEKTCETCGKVIGGETIKALGHTEKVINAEEPTCTENGKSVKTICSVCGEVLADAEVIPALGHDYKTMLTKATTKANGKKVVVCERCDNIESTTVIYKASDIKLAYKSTIYNKKIRKPAVVVKDSKGKKIGAENYSVTYAKGRKYVGKYKVTIKLGGDYKGTVIRYFKILPKTTTIKSLTAVKGGFKVSYAKQSVQTTGYQIRYSTSSKMTNAKSVKITKNTTLTRTVNKLKNGKKYYVQVRTYKKIDGKFYYSKWTKVKSVTTK